MAIFSWLTSLLLYFILFSLSISLGSHSDYNKTCPTSACGDIKEINYPFYNGTHNPIPYPFFDVNHSLCGFYKIDCVKSRPTIQIQIGVVGRSYTVKNISYEERQIVIQDHRLYERLEAKDCNSLYNFTNSEYLVVPDYFMELTSPMINIFNCEYYTLPLPPHVQFKISNYTGCKNSVLYFIDELDTLPPQSFPRERCSRFEIPVSDSSLLFNQNWTDDRLLPLLNKGFNLRWRPFPVCDKCHKKGGHCWKNNTTEIIWCCDDDCGDPGKPSKKKLIAIATATGGFIGILTIVILLLSLLRKKFFFNNIFMSKGIKNNSRNVEVFLKAYGSLGPKRYNYKDVKKMTDSFRDKIGEGGYGAVYKGKLLDGRCVAVKVLSVSKGNGEEFINEVASIGRTEHVNVVSLLGFCSEGHKRALIYEFMPNGSLEKFIFTKDTRTSHDLGWTKLYQIAVGSARGLEYLHRGCNTRILHFDIKPHNILLDKDFCPKISDFGLAKLCPTRQSTISMHDARGTVGYIAPEVCCRNFGGISSKSDVYSYGMMVLEMVGRRKNIEVGVENTSEIFFPHWIHMRLDLNEDLGLGEHLTEEEEEIARKMIIVGLWCIQTYPATRPAMNRVLDMLEGSLEVLQMPPKPILSSPSRSNEVTSTTLQL